MGKIFAVFAFALLGLMPSQAIGEVSILGFRASMSDQQIRSNIVRLGMRCGTADRLGNGELMTSCSDLKVINLGGNEFPDLASDITKTTDFSDSLIAIHCNVFNGCAMDASDIITAIEAQKPSLRFGSRQKKNVGHKRNTWYCADNSGLDICVVYGPGIYCEPFCWGANSHLVIFRPKKSDEVNLD